jgi:hypothetical protein
MQSALPCLHGGSLGSSVVELQGTALACERRPAARKLRERPSGAKAVRTDRRSASTAARGKVSAIQPDDSWPGGSGCVSRRQRHTPGSTGDPGVSGAAARLVIRVRRDRSARTGVAMMDGPVAWPCRYTSLLNTRPTDHWGSCLDRLLSGRHAGITRSHCNRLRSRQTGYRFTWCRLWYVRELPRLPSRTGCGRRDRR